MDDAQPDPGDATDGIRQPASPRREPLRLAERDLGLCLVTGGSGYLASHLTRELLDRGLRVRAIDLRDPVLEDPDYDFRRGDLRRRDDVLEAVRGVDTIFHTAAVVDFVGFASRARRRRSIELNIGATRHLLSAARSCGVSRLVYTSSSNVVLGEPVRDADGSTPYPSRYHDLYSATKSRAERAVLEANDADGLLTCALRPGGIYGPGDPFYLPTLLDKCVRGLLVADVGDGRGVSDNTFVGNLVHGEILAARSLVPGSPSAGRVYYITDGEPVPRLEFFRPLIEGAGFRHPRMRLPFRLAFWTAFAWEVLARFRLAPEPALTRMQVMAAALSHSGSLHEARRDLGYEPIFDWRKERERCLPWCEEVVARMRAGDWP